MIPKVSVIVPVYNANKGLRRCVDSILAQTYVNFELLLINDGSTDGSNEICDEYAKKDVRVRVFHKRNGGVSSARNIGLENATGEWISFVDSDDWVSEFYLQHLISYSYDVDLVFSYAEFVYSDGSHRKEVYDSMIVTDNYEKLIIQNDLSWHTSPWAKLFRRSLCANIRFVEGMHIGEDLVFLYTYMLECQKIYVSSDTDYLYYVGNQVSLTKRINHLHEELLAYNQISNTVNCFIVEKNIISAIALDKMGWILAYYIRRILNALYYDGEERTRSQRITHIKSLDMHKYINHIEITSIKEQIYLYMLKYKMYVVYDIVRVFSRRMKRWNIQL